MTQLARPGCAPASLRTAAALARQIAAQRAAADTASPNGAPPQNLTARPADSTSLMGPAPTPAAAAPLPVRRRLPGTTRSVQDARRLVQDALPGCPRADDLALAASELAANAVAWSAAGENGHFTITIRTAPRWARVEITDPGPAAHPTATGNGYGLAIIAGITDRHGTRHGPGTIRTTWAETTWPGPQHTPAAALPGQDNPA